MGQLKFRRFESFWIDLQPTIGVEMQKLRPCVILSCNEMNERLGTIIIAPITSKIRQLPFRVSIILQGKNGEVALDQLRAVDKSRLGKSLGNLAEKETEEIIRKLAEMFAK